MRIDPGASGRGLSLTLALEATRAEAADGEAPAQAILLRFSARW